MDQPNQGDQNIQDIFKTIAVIVNEQQLKQYQMITNSPGYQHVTYLHFHLQAENKAGFGITQIR